MREHKLKRVNLDMGWRYVRAVSEFRKENNIPSIYNMDSYQKGNDITLLLITIPRLFDEMVINRFARVSWGI